MIKKLNNKGITTAEVLVCFVLIVLISMSIYSIVDTYSNRHRIESFKEKIVTYKNLLTKEINSDLIKKGLNAVGGHSSINKSLNDLGVYDYSTKFMLANGEIRCLTVSSIVHEPNFLKNTTGYVGSATCNGTCSGTEKFEIGYGECGNEIMYPLPDLGFSYNSDKEKIYDLRIISVNVNTTNNVLAIDIRFYHPELGSKYGINIVNPIGFSL